MDTTKWKSVLVPIDTYWRIYAVAKAEDRGIGRQLTRIFNEWERDCFKEQHVNAAERRLRALLLRGGFPGGRWLQPHRFADRTLGTTTPDVTYDDLDDSDRKIYIYLDGLSGHIHGNAETRLQDMQIRQELMAAGNDVLVIAAHDLGDQQIMTRHFKRLARILEGRQAVARIVEEVDTWFGEADSGSADDDADDDADD